MGARAGPPWPLLLLAAAALAAAGGTLVSAQGAQPAPPGPGAFENRTLADEDFTVSAVGPATVAFNVPAAGPGLGATTVWVAVRVDGGAWRGFNLTGLPSPCSDLFQDVPLPDGLLQAGTDYGIWLGPGFPPTVDVRLDVAALADATGDAVGRQGSAQASCQVEAGPREVQWQVDSGTARGHLSIWAEVFVPLPTTSSGAPTPTPTTSPTPTVEPFPPTTSEAPTPPEPTPEPTPDPQPSKSRAAPGTFTRRPLLSPATAPLEPCRVSTPGDGDGVHVCAVMPDVDVPVALAAGAGALLLGGLAARHFLTKPPGQMAPPPQAGAPPGSPPRPPALRMQTAGRSMRPDTAPEPAAAEGGHALEPRRLNASLSRPDGTPWDPARPVPPSQELLAVVDIGPRRADSVLPADAPAFPDHALPRSATGHTLRVVVASDRFTVGPDARRYFLPPSGPGWPCDCETEDRCSGHGGPVPLRVPVTAPAEAGSASLRIAAYYRNNLVQSAGIEASVGTPPPSGVPAVRGEVDYTLDPDLAALDRLPPVGLNLLHNEDETGTHRIVLFDGQAPAASVIHLADHQVATAIRDARARLRAAHATPAEQGPPLNLYDPNGAKPRDAFIADLRRLAEIGTQLYHVLSVQAGAELGLFEASLRQAGVRIQAARTRRSTLYFPWALVYDLPNDGLPDALEPCPMLRDWTGDPARALPDDCPHGCRDAYNRLCLYGFWGVRHRLEEPPSLADGGRFTTTVRARNAPPRMAVLRSTRLDPGITERHFRSLAPLVRPLSLTDHSDRNAALEALSQPDLEVVYFYGHGGAEGTEPYLEVGTNERIHPKLLTNRRRTWKDGHWRPHGPIVVLNGCGTVAMRVEDLTQFVDTFTLLNASGVIGTEVPLDQTVAGLAGQEILHGLLRGSVADAVRRMRLRLLARGNVMGLAYTAYCPGELRLET